MKHLLAVMLSVALAGVAGAAEETPEPATSCPFATGVLKTGYEGRVTYTREAGFRDFFTTHTGGRELDTTEVTVSLEHVLSEAWSCATWSVELLLPPELSLATKTGYATETEVTALTRTSVAKFAVELDDIRIETSSSTSDRQASHVEVGETRTHRGWLAVKVFNGQDSAVFIDGFTDGQGRVHYPVDFIVHRHYRFRLPR